MELINKYMKKNKPGDVFNKFQMKKRKVSLQGIENTAKNVAGKLGNAVKNTVKTTGMLGKGFVNAMSGKADKAMGKSFGSMKPISGPVSPARMKPKKRKKIAKKVMKKKGMSATGGAYVRDYSKYGRGSGNAKTLAPAMASGKASYDPRSNEYIMTASGSSRSNAISKMPNASGYGKTMKKRSRKSK